MQKITPCIWFEKDAEKAVDFYISLFKNSKIGAVTKYDEASAKASGQPQGSVLTVDFEIEGQQFLALNGGTHFKLSGAISFVINCETQDEVDYFWNKLSEGGNPMPCGWVTDKFGVTWQVVPIVLNKMLTDKDPVKAKRVMEAMLEMSKIDIPTLEKAYNSA